jgi:hypothetical protein
MKKRKRVSKHVTNAKAAADDTTNATALPAAKAKKTNAKAAAHHHHKDPSEGYHYLNAWSLKLPEWHFNKNMQSWLLRHMYEADKVNKTSFTILLEYLQKLQGRNARKRVLEEATARAQRYRVYEASVQASKEKEGSTETSAEEPSSTPKEKEATAALTAADEEENFGLERWKTLEDHDKRKEYKRAFRVLEAMTAKDAAAQAPR